MSSGKNKPKEPKRSYVLVQCDYCGFNTKIHVDTVKQILQTQDNKTVLRSNPTPIGGDK